MFNCSWISLKYHCRFQWHQTKKFYCKCNGYVSSKTLTMRRPMISPGRTDKLKFKIKNTYVTVLYDGRLRLKYQRYTDDLTDPNSAYYRELTFTSCIMVRLTLCIIIYIIYSMWRYGFCSQLDIHALLISE